MRWIVFISLFFAGPVAAFERPSQDRCIAAFEATKSLEASVAPLENFAILIAELDPPQLLSPERVKDQSLEVIGKIRALYDLLADICKTERPPSKVTAIAVEGCRGVLEAHRADLTDPLLTIEDFTYRVYASGSDAIRALSLSISVATHDIAASYSVSYSNAYKMCLGYNH